MPVTSMALADDVPCGDIQRGKQRGRPMPDVVMGLPRRDAQPHWQQGARALQCLHLTLLIDTKN